MAQRRPRPGDRRQRLLGVCVGRTARAVCRALRRTQRERTRTCVGPRRPPPARERRTRRRHLFVGPAPERRGRAHPQSARHATHTPRRARRGRHLACVRQSAAGEQLQREWRRKDVGPPRGACAPRDKQRPVCRHAGNTRPHGVSSLVYAQTRRRLYAACTDGWYVSLSDAVCTSSTRVSRPMRFRRTSRGRCTMPCSAATRCTRVPRCTTSATLRSAATRATLSSGTRTRRTPPCSPVRTKKSTSSD